MTDLIKEHLRLHKNKVKIGVLNNYENQLSSDGDENASKGSGQVF